MKLQGKKESIAGQRGYCILVKTNDEFEKLKHSLLYTTNLEHMFCSNGPIML